MEHDFVFLFSPFHSLALKKTMSFIIGCIKFGAYTTKRQGPSLQFEICVAKQMRQLKLISSGAEKKSCNFGYLFDIGNVGRMPDEKLSSCLSN